MEIAAGWTFEEAHRRLLAIAVGTLSATTLLKVGAVQYLEIFLAFDLLVILWLFARDRYRVKVFKPFLNLVTSYGIFLLIAFLLALLALRGDFTTPDNILKRPLIVTLARMAELFLDVFYMFYLASLYRKDRAFCRFGVLVYFWTGVAGCLFALLTFPLNFFFGIQSGTYSDAHRLRGFDNEGGPFGTYLISVMVLTVAMRHTGWLTRRQFFAAMGFFLFCFAGAQSKGGFIALAVVALFYLMASQVGVRRWVIAITTCLVFAAAAWLVDLPKKIEVYFQDSAIYSQVSNLRYADSNYVMGRVAGAVLAPRMIAEHPWAGIGWGNYPIVRDNPIYRQGAAYSFSDIDAPALGPVDYIVDFGIPLFLYFTWIGLKPIFMLRRIRADATLLTLAFVQPVSVWAGAHLNLTHPWVVAGFALGMAYRVPSWQTLPAEAPAVQHELTLNPVSSSGDSSAHVS